MEREREVGRGREGGGRKGERGLLSNVQITDCTIFYLAFLGESLRASELTKITWKSSVTKRSLIRNRSPACEFLLPYDLYQFLVRFGT